MKVAASVLLVAAAVVGVSECALVVITEGGRIEGKSETSINGRTFHSYYGIPYARPPLGEFRFKDPVKPGTWQRLANAKKMPPPCMQVPLVNAMLNQWPEPEEISGSENCLFLNVFTPVTGPYPEKQKLPVMVWLHGGGFFAGGAEEYLPHTFLNHDVLLVVVQYRLGVLGFLSTEDSVMPGNLGLKDQTMALQWVQRNIHRFGGDKARVTIFGESAGGASVHYQMLTPKAKGLFSQAIMQSGSALAPWAFNNRHRNAAESVGRSQGCEDVQNSTALLECLQKSNAKELTHAIQNEFQWFCMPAVMAPRVDGDYLPDLPAKLLAEKQYHEVDLMSGVTKDEGSLVTLAIDSQKLINDLEKHFDTYGPITIGLEKEEDPVTVAKRIYNHYLGDITSAGNHFDQLTELFGDRFFKLNQDEVIKRHAVHFPDRRTFRYQFDYRGKHSLGDALNSSLGKNTVCHLDDLIYLFADGTLFGSLVPNGLTDPEDTRMREMMLKLWTNFAILGNPTPDDSLGFKWEPSTADNLHYLSLTPSPSMQPDNREEARKFFNSLPMTANLILHPHLVADHTGDTSGAAHTSKVEL
ncbi:venom carboxylesterase-6-like isoform X4 [Eriocheir sinensis]|uniref:venom carboxylesterase-6-like isoform X4 n=1 Tax=Eriocheir sinensis TaxID=95602 RepID=UPI0021C9E78E|nr:venom carboxylesterase-6-like isoform X4 [Eriocheir sinensis]